MCSINHNLKAIYFHIPKVGGLYIEKILQKYYDFETYYFTADNHSDYFEEKHDNHLSEFKGFLNIRTKGMYRYYINSKNFNYISGMTEDRWKEYKKFTFVRNPYERCISAYKYLELENKKISIIGALLDSDELNNYEYGHIIISQYNHIINNNNEIEFDYIGRFENLNEELIKILMKLGIKEIKHKYYLENNIKINSSSVTNKKEYLTNELLEIINRIFVNDFNEFNYKQYTDIKEYKKINTETSNEELLKKYAFEPKNDFFRNKELDKNMELIEIPNKMKIENDIKTNIFRKCLLSKGK